VSQESGFYVVQAQRELLDKEYHQLQHLLFPREQEEGKGKIEVMVASLLKVPRGLLELWQQRLCLSQNSAS